MRLEKMGYESEFQFLQIFKNRSYAFNVIPPVPDFKWFESLDEVKQAKPITERCAYALHFPHTFFLA